MPPVKVLHLIPTLAGGGAERQLVNVVRSTSRAIVDHTVCVINDAEFFAPHIREASYKVIELAIPTKRPFLEAARKFRAVIRDERPDVIQSWLYDANISARIAGAPPFQNLPQITSLQLADYEPAAAQIARWNPVKVIGLKLLDKITAGLTKPYFVACSDFVKNSYIRNYGLDLARTQVIYNAVDPNALIAPPGSVDELRRELNLTADSFIYLNVGRLDPQKNHTVLFHAFEQLVAAQPNAHLLLAGVGTMESELRSLATSLNLDERIQFLSRRNDVGALLELADVFVFPSYFEGLPVGLIEAMSKSLPCIASRIDVFEEVITDTENGLLIDPDSSTELAKAMDDLYRNPGVRKALGIAASETIEARFASSTTARQWEELFQRLAGKGVSS